MIGMISHKLDSNINPIVLKELRQAVKGRFIAAVLMLFLIVSLLVLGGFLLFSDVSRGTDLGSGRVALYFFQAVLVITCILFLPLYAGIRMAFERSDMNTDLMFITTIPPRAVIWGKLLATTLLAVLIYSACMPFMTLTYLMRGVDLPSIFFVLGLGFIVVLVAIHLAIFVASITPSLVARVLLGLGLMGTLLMMIGYTIAGSAAAVEFGIGSTMGNWDFWGPALTVIAFAVLLMGQMFVFSVALIKPPSANKALPVRLYMSAVWLIGTIAALLWAIEIQQAEVLGVWLILTMLYAVLGMLIATSERENWGVRIARTIPENPIKRWMVFFLYSGSGGGMLWAVGMALTTALLGMVWQHQPDWFSWHHEIDSEVFAGAMGIPLYAFAYCMTSIMLQRYVLRGFIRKSHTWALALILIAAGTVFTLFVGQLIMNASPWDSRNATIFWLPNPFGLASDDYRFSCMVFAATWASVMLLISVPWFVGQLDRFRPHQDQPANDSAADPPPPPPVPSV